MSSENGLDCPVRFHASYAPFTDRIDAALIEYTSFEEWNKNAKISAAASELYGGDINQLELYPGLHAEGILGDGINDYSGDPLRVNTMRNGLLLDAVALVSS